MSIPHDSAAVEAENLVIAFGGFRAVDGITFRVERGEVFGFLGANGAGKTTTIRALCGILTPTSGVMRVGGIDVLKRPGEVKKIVGYMSQRFTLYPDITVAENLEFAGALRKIPPEKIKARAAELFEFIGAERGLSKELVASLSGGTRQQVALAAALLHEPQIIFLDEPTAGVSPAARAAFWRLIKQLADAGKTVFVTTHYMDEVERCSRIALMQAGRIIALDTPTRLKAGAFPAGMVEITPPEGEIQPALRDFAASGAGEAQITGRTLRAEIKNRAGWEKFERDWKTRARISDIPASLEDVFLKLVSAGGAK